MLYKNEQTIGQIVPVCFSHDDEQFIPISINGDDRITITDDTGYHGLIRKIQRSPEYQLPERPTATQFLKLQSKIIPPIFAPPTQPETIANCDVGFTPQNPMLGVTQSEFVKHGKYLVVKTLPSSLISSLDVADDILLERKVVIKSVTSLEDQSHFEKEAIELARVGKHPNIVTVYGAWLKAVPPHYVREYIDGESVYEKLRTDRTADLPIDFVHQVIVTLGDAMIFAMQKNVFDLGLDPEKVLIRTQDVTSLPGHISNYAAVILPGPGGSDYIKRHLPRRLPKLGQLYVPPEYFYENSASIDPGRANQYRLGILGYEMLVGCERFSEIAEKQIEPLNRRTTWPPLKSIDKTERCPRFLRDAIDRMIQTDPLDRYPTLDEAVEAFANRNVLVEVARDSFRRIIDKDNHTRFFREFYTQLLKNNDVRQVFEHARFPSIKKETGANDKNWPRQFGLLKEAVVILFAYSLLKEADEPTLLSRISDLHAKIMSTEFYDDFGDKLIETVIKFDKGNSPRILELAWRQAIEPGLNYLKSQFPIARRKVEAASNNVRMDGFEKVRVESRRQGELIGRIATLQELSGVDLTPIDELSAYDIPKLSKIAQDLQNRLRDRD